MQGEDMACLPSKIEPVPFFQAAGVYGMSRSSYVFIPIQTLVA